MVPLVLVVAFELSGCGPAVATPANEDRVREKRIEQMFAEYRRNFPETPQVTAEELVSQLDSERLLLVDVRTTVEQHVSMLAHAITQEEFDRKREQYKKRKIICYCTIGYRSGLFAKKLRSQGFDAYNFKGGVLAWAHAHQYFFSNDGPTWKVHVYGPKWNLLPLGYEAVW